MGAAGPVNPEGRSVSGGPEPTGFLERSGREEPAPELSSKGAGGEKTRRRRFHQGTAPPVGLAPKQGDDPETQRGQSKPA